MSKYALRHPEDGVLLEYLDGELNRGQAKAVQGHLDACWQCRAGLEELQNAMNECVRYRAQVVMPSTPPPPAPWGSLDFGRIDTELAAESFTTRIARWLSPRHAPLRWALTGALALALAAVAVRQLRETPNVQAAALLRKAVEISATRPHPVKRLSIVSSRGPLVRSVGAATKPAAEEAEMARWFAAARYDWNDPLNARAYAAWHDALERKVDEVASADPALYSIKTTTPDSELVSATLKLRKTDFAPVAGRFEFRNHEWVEMTELVDQLNPASTVAVAGTTGGTPRQPGVPPGPSLSEPVAANPAPAPNEELQVVAALHLVGADLGDPLEISREGRQVVVSGAGIGPQRQQQIHNQLDRLPHVVVRFTDPTFPASTPAPVEPATTRDAAVTAERSTQQAQIEQRLGGRPQFERFSGQILDWTDSAMSRAYALRRLAQQFPASSEAVLSDPDRRTLHTLGREHLAAMQSDLARIQTTIQPVLAQMGAAARPPQPHSSAQWQAASEQMLASARRVETLLAAVLGVAPGAGKGDATSQLRTALAQLTGDIEQCQRLLSYD